MVGRESAVRLLSSITRFVWGVLPQSDCLALGGREFRG